jgi:hypothetical protein
MRWDYLILAAIVSPYLLFAVAAVRDWWQNRGQRHHARPTLPPKLDKYGGQ